ncbi:MAG: hypothetical protein ACTHQE_04510, partial [Thermomicrobiales bacterium]
HPPDFYDSPLPDASHLVAATATACLAHACCPRHGSSALLGQHMAGPKAGPRIVLKTTVAPSAADSSVLAPLFVMIFTIVSGSPTMSA